MFTLDEGIIYVSIMQNHFTLLRHSPLSFFRIPYIHRAKACLTHSLNHLLNCMKVSYLPLLLI